ncbi:MAG: hypothetical protein CMQ13_04070 [Gammaproteobacteria bacterium]|nr:hypothetical protein [Gammaproteobacteria bacterium]
MFLLSMLIEKQLFPLFFISDMCFIAVFLKKITFCTKGIKQTVDTGFKWQGFATCMPPLLPLSAITCHFAR